MLTNANLPNLIYQRTIIQNPATSKLHIFKKICYTKALMTNFEDFWAKMIWWSFFSQYFSSTQGSTNCDILASGMRGSGDRERKWEDKFHPQVLKMFFFHWKGLKMDPKELKPMFLYQRYLCFGGNFVCGTYAFRGNNSEWGQPGGKPHN